MEVQTKVISLKGKRDVYGPSLELAPKDVVYIGRNLTMGGWRLKCSPFYNPFVVKNGKLTRDEAVANYQAYIEEKISKDREFRNQLINLKGKTLACWCHPEECHGDVIIQYINKLTQ